jgi:hypothetical protein
VNEDDLKQMRYQEMRAHERDTVIVIAIAALLTSVVLAFVW